MINKSFTHLLTLLAAASLSFLSFSIELSAQTPSSETPQPASVRDARVTAPPDDMFIELQVPNHQIYLGETLKIEYDVYVASKLGQVFYDVEDPDFSKWANIEGVTPHPSPASFHGKSYTREPFAVYFVSPGIPGKLPLPQLKVQVPYIQSKPWITHGPVFVEVLPLPDPQPSGFYHRNVGQFSLKVEHTETNVRVGDLITFNVQITGSTPGSNVQLVPYQLRAFPDAFWIYPPIDEGISKSNIGDHLITQKKLRYRMLALKEGEWTLPPFTLVSFDPQSHQYKTQTTESFKVSVEPSKQLEPIIKYKAKPLLMYHQQISDIQLKKPDNYTLSYGWLILPIGIFLLFIAGILSYENREKLRKQLEKRSSPQTLINDISNAETPDIQIARMTELLEQRFGIPKDQQDIKESLLNAFSEEDANLILNTLQEMKMATYSTHKPIQNEQLIKVLELLRSSR